MTTRFANTEDGIDTREISDTGDYLVARGGEWYYWIATTSPRENHGPYTSEADALAAYNAASGTTYTAADVD